MPKSYNLRQASPKAVARICIADDDPLCSDLMQYNLAGAGYDVKVFNDVNAAYSADLSDFDLFIIDIAMNGGSGFHLAHYLKQSTATQSRPLLFCSARSYEDAIINALDNGADDYLLKPFAMAELMLTVKSMIRQRQPARRS